MEQRMKKWAIACLICIACFMVSCDTRYGDKIVASISKEISGLPEINIESSGKFLNDLKLSPFWKVERDREGNFYAVARSLSSSDPFLEPNPNQFLFTFMKLDRPLLPKDYTVRNAYLDGNEDYSTLSAKIVFRQPIDKTIAYYVAGTDIKLDIYESYEKTIGPNSFSKLAIKLDADKDIYMIVREQGKDRKRKTTFNILPELLEHIKDISQFPIQYRTSEKYKKFYDTFFPSPDKDIDMWRFPGTQGRDMFYGYFISQSNLSYEGINIKISNQEYCDGECTRDYSRLDKAEYLGRPHYDNDKLFFSIEDNAVYLSAEHDKEFGYFSGNNKFEAEIEILNDESEILYKTKGMFTGWER